MFRIKRLMDTQPHLEPEIVRMIMSLAHAIGFTETLFVSAAGDNSDGSSWNRAYTSLKTALDWIANNQAAGESHCIMIGASTFDIDTTGEPEYRELSIGLIGMGRNSTFITNDHATATSILVFDGCELIISGLTFHTGNNNITGLKLVEDVGGLGHGTFINDVEFHAYTPTGAHSLLYLESDVEGLRMTNCWFYGLNTMTTGIYTDDATSNYYENIHFDNCLIGIHLSDSDDRFNFFKNIYFRYCDTCIQIDDVAATLNHFENIYFEYTYTTIIDDTSAQSYFYNLYKNQLMAEATEIYLPDDITGVIITAGVGANIWSAVDADVVPAVAATAPYRLLGFSYECAATEKYALRFIAGGTDYITRILLEGTANICKNYYFERPIWIQQGEALQASAKSETGGNNILVWAIIEMF